MDELGMLERMGKILPRPDEKVLARSRAALIDVINGSLSAAPRVKPPARKRWLIAIPAVALGLAIILLVELGLPGTKSGRPPSAAAAVLNQLADAASEQPYAGIPRPDQFWYYKAIGVGNPDGFGDPGQPTWSAQIPVVYESWSNPDPSIAGRGLTQSRGVSTWIFPTEQDWQRWVHQGRPTKGKGWNTLRRDDSALHSSAVVPPPTYEQLANLPTDTTALYKALTSPAFLTNEGYGPDYPGDLPMYEILEDLLIQAWLPPDLRAALFRVAATLPGVQSLGTVADHSGRPGVGISFSRYGTRYEMVIDPNTSLVLGEQEVLDHPGNPVDAAGRPVADPARSWEVYVDWGVVDTTTARPQT